MKIAGVWADLPSHICEAIHTLVDAGTRCRLNVGQANVSASPVGQSDHETESIESLAWKIARQCRSIVQSWLREDEWQDVDQEFFEIIVVGLRGSEERA